NFHSKKGYVLGANGASAVYRKILLQELGGFEESFFAYQEENDLHMRAFYNGWKCFYVPEAVVYHKGSYSFKKVPEIFHYYHERNRIWFIYRNFSLSIIFRFLPVIIFRELRTMIKLVVIKRKPVIYFKARYDGFTGMFQFKNQRKKSLIAAKEFSGTLLTLFKNKILSSQ
ncbi:MAG TPA: glycosyltransferase family 2 protein, partial [Chitinispirillaceae bacterium]|nr:glycosyltransferase family 2 protein [Chitinispirillaceae bacterium]